MHASILARHDLDGTAVPPSAMHSTPQHAPLRHLSLFRLIFSASNPQEIPRGISESSGRKNAAPAALPADGVVILEPFWERPAGPKHTRAEQVES
jgi:hypothetical protein